MSEPYGMPSTAPPFPRQMPREWGAFWTPLLAGNVLTAVYRQCRPGNVTGFFRGEEGDAAGDLIGHAEPSDRDAGDDLLQDVLRHRRNHLGVDIAGRDGVDRDALLGVFLRQRLGEADHAGLGGRIVGLANLALLAVDRRDVDDAAEVALAHALDDVAGHVEDRGEVDADDLAPLLLGHAVQHRIAGDAGVVDQGVDGPELLLDPLHRRRAVGEGRDVALHRHHAQLIGATLGRDLVAGVAGGHLVARGAEPGADRPSDAARSARVKGHPGHLLLSLYCSFRHPGRSEAESRGLTHRVEAELVWAPARPAPAQGRGDGASARSGHIASTVIATPMPPPTQSVARPLRAPERCISCSRVVRMRAPDAPIGWPMAIAPPLTFTLAGSRPSSRTTLSDWAAKASLLSIRSRSETFQPAFSSAFWVAGIGPVPMISGGTPACAHEAMRASGFRPRRLASPAVISTSAAAPSLRPEALAAVTVPSLLKAGRRPEMLSRVTPWRTYSSSATMVSPLRPLMVTG